MPLAVSNQEMTSNTCDEPDEVMNLIGKNELPQLPPEDVTDLTSEGEYMDVGEGSVTNLRSLWM